MLEFDHLVLTVRDPAATAAFYRRLLGLRPRRRPDGRTALHGAALKLNLHRAGERAALVAAAAAPGTADFCLRTAQPVEALAERAAAAGIPLLGGAVDRDGARAPLRSIYLRDPDGNLVELANEAPGGDEPVRVASEAAAAERPFPGVEIRRLWSDPRGARVVLVAIEAGAGWTDVDRHDSGPELVFVLAGGFEDEAGRHPAGTLIRYPAGSRHTPRSTDGCRMLVFYPEG